MDINSLLSPSEPLVKPPNAAQTAQASLSPRRKATRPGGGKRTTSNLSQEIILDDSPPKDAPRSVPAQGSDGYFQTRHNPSVSSGFSAINDARSSQNNSLTPTSEARSPYGTPQPHRPSLSYTPRQQSMTSIETLADMAAMQQHQQTRHQSLVEAHRSSTPASRHNSLAPPINRTLSSTTDLAMADAPAQTPTPRAFTAPSLSDADVQTVKALVEFLSTNSYAYDSHVQLINMLHRGFVAHVHNASGDSHHSPANYSLLSDLRQAREAMDSRFAVGEDIWKDWIHDESLLARSSDDRISIMELCQKAVQEEPASVALWKLYGDCVIQTYTIANGYAEADPTQWTAEDKEICKEVFTREVILDVWERAVEATRWRIDESHTIWDQYSDQVMQEFPENPSSKAVDQIVTMFMTRLQVPHATWSETSSKFWPIVSKHNAENWEEIMAAANELGQPAKQQYGLREVHELAVKRAAESEDKTALYNAFSDYLKWERKNKRHASFTIDVRSALFERALLKFPTVIDWWLDYVDYLLEANNASPEILSIMERATRHCPWSGELWSRRILRCDVQQLSYGEVEAVKHKATNSGLLDIGGMEELLKAYSAWCSYLRRRAFDPNNTDDEVDMADMGITGTLEDVQVAGKKIYGEEFRGDPLMRLEAIHIKFLTEARRFDDARACFERLSATHSIYEGFWRGYYEWEMLIWAHARISEAVRVETPEAAPTRASEVLRRAMNQRDLDYPEKILNLYLLFSQLNESAENLQKAESTIRIARMHVQQRRAREAAEAAAATTEVQPQQVNLETIPEETTIPSKRKRDDESVEHDLDGAKKSKVGEIQQAEPPHFEASASASAQIKRDREHNTITVKDLPADVSEKRIRQFFGDCGKILSIGIVHDDNAMTAHATIEFETHEDVLTAKTRDGKSIDGNSVRIQSGTLSTLYVTNFPADFDETKIRELFDSYGTIVSVRFPSLKYNSRRRFCYVQFLSAEEARTATALDGKAIDGQHTLTALISDPDAKKSRSGATSEGRELYVRNVDFTASQAEIREFFEEYGQVQNVRMVKGATGRPTGTVFVVYNTADEANAALAMNNKPLKSRLVSVSLATDKSSAQKATNTKMIRQSAEPGSPPEETNGDGRRASVVSSASGTAANDSNTLDAETAKTKRQRTVALLGLPDTVNDSRIQSHMEQYGPLRKITVRRDKGGAIVEFVNLQDAGKASMGIDCSALGPNVRVGNVPELLAGKPPRSNGTNPATGAAPKKDGAPSMMKPAQAAVSRPAQKGTGRRGGLGFKRGGFGGASKNGDGEDKAMADSNGDDKAARSNADFRALFEQSKEGKADTAESEDAA